MLIGLSDVRVAVGSGRLPLQRSKHADHMRSILSVRDIRFSYSLDSDTVWPSIDVRRASLQTDCIWLLMYTRSARASVPWLHEVGSWPVHVPLSLLLHEVGSWQLPVPLSLHENGSWRCRVVPVILPSDLLIATLDEWQSGLRAGDCRVRLTAYRLGELSGVRVALLNSLGVFGSLSLHTDRPSTTSPCSPSPHKTFHMCFSYSFSCFRI